MLIEYFVSLLTCGASVLFVARQESQGMDPNAERQNAELGK